MYKWNDDIATGIAEIDKQHQELFARINSILEACSRKKGRAEVASYLTFLEAYVVEHFQAEEKQMRAQAYPALAAHHGEHVQFTSQIAKIMKEFNEYGTAIHVLLMAVRASGDWLVSHIKKTDKAMAAFLRSKQSTK